MSVRLTILCALLTLTALTGCGNKGPLYLPEPAPASGGDSPADGDA
jgi:predicted small lipoprotein YifL